MTFFLLQNTKKGILKNVSVHTMKVSGVQNNSGPHWVCLHALIFVVYMNLQHCNPIFGDKEIDPEVDLNLYEFLSFAEYKRRYFEEYR